MAYKQMHVRNDLSAAYVRTILDYDPITGIFKWKTTGRGRRLDLVAGCKRKDGYIVIRIGSGLYLAHRIAYLIMTGGWPPQEIDHRHLDPSDNRWTSIRQATYHQNRANRGKPKTNTSGHKNVYRDRGGRWRVFVNERWIGSFASKDNAITAARQAIIRLNGEFGRW